MYVCEAVLMAIIVMLGVYVTYTDIKNGLIKNSALILAFIAGAIVNSIYFGFFCKEYLVTYLTNFVIMSLLAIALYGFHFWAGGDSKLLICVTSLFPTRLYDSGTFSFAPGIDSIIFIFLIAYLYIIIDSIISFVKKSRFYSTKFMSLRELKVFALDYVVCFLYLRGLGEILRSLLHNFYYENQLVFSFFNVFLAIIIYSNKLFKRWFLLLPVIAINIVFFKTYSFDLMALYSYGVLLFALLLRRLLNGYNYQEIETGSVEKGMVLSCMTIMYFIPSRIKGLPNKSYEDMRSRLSQDEVEAIKRWKDSKYGKEKIVIVRKIPFAIFIIAGELMFFFVRIWRW